MKNMKKSRLILFLSILTILIITFSLILVNSGDKKNDENTQNYNIVNVEDVETPEDNIYNGSFKGEENLEVETFEEENPDIISGSTEYDENDFVVGNTISTTVYYSQIDSRWANHPYTSVGKASQTIGSSGCGPTSAAMVVSTIKGVVRPDTMGDLYVKYGFRSADNGTYASAFQWTANKYGIEFSRVYNVDNMINLVRNDYIVVVSCSSGLFTTGGHYIVVYGIEGNTLKIYDPYLYSGKFNSYGRSGKVTLSGNTVLCSITNFKNYANSKGYFGFKRENNVDPTPEYTHKYNVGDRVLVDVPVNIAYDNGGDKIIVDSNGYQFWINRSVVINNRVYGLGDIIRIEGNNLYEVRIFEEKFDCREEYLSNPPKEENKTTNNTTNNTTTNTTTNTTSYVLGKYVTNTNLNVRSGPSTKYRIVKTYSKGTRFDTKQINGDWAKTPSGWVNLKYCRLVYKY